MPANWTSLGRLSVLIGLLVVAFGAVAWVFDERAEAVASVEVAKSETRHEGTHDSEKEVAAIRQDAVLQALDRMDTRVQALIEWHMQEAARQYQQRGD